MPLRIVSAIIFSPRGGSAHVARDLTLALRAQGHDVTLVAGSRTDLGIHGDAEAFYGDLHVVDFGPALASADPMRFEGPAGTAPMHPSFEDRPGAADRVFASLDDLELERQVRAWARELSRAGAGDADVLHLHHLTPLNEAAAIVAPRTPVVSQLHGTELLMLERIADGPPASWSHAGRWAERMRGWAKRSERVIVGPGATARAVGALGVPAEKVVELSNGVNTERFFPRAVDRRAFWRRVLVDQPQGALPGAGLGSARYHPSAVSRLASGTVLLYVGRFTAVKRLDRLIGAFARLPAERSNGPVSLVLVGGHPGEWEGEHPADLAARLRAHDVYLAGWYAHDTLPEFFSAADAVVTASELEQFGQVLIEGMACGLPAVATLSLGPRWIIERGRTGWLCEPSETALAATLAEVVSSSAERRRRGELARRSVYERFSWAGVSRQLVSVFEQVRHRSRSAAVGGRTS
jgi:glycosyltransferase involved in cell wall biosynthesis